MRNSLKKLTMAVGAATAAIALGATTASAGVSAPTWTVGPTSPEAFSASAGTVTLALNGIPLTCTSSAAQGNLATAAGTTNVTVGTITPLTWSGCTSPFGPVTPTANTSPAWKLNANSYSAGVTSGYISGIKATLSVLTCSFTVTGNAAATYTNSTGKLAVSNNATYKLTVTTVTAGCAGIAAVGNNPTYTASYNAVTPVGGTTKPTIVYTP
ncbi:hypothetical protein [Streptomyces sp. RKAG290]|uniref:hypothetical protein n=1 Tax=Streptomyces sp. RKAG290 TaxID=2888348 RepID=UPI0020335F2E|nr:hypothetical protein [Streptomyces sp. RKAG290]MCM2410446.1 hypothetical protein [Streptomyces sp. RKAG290]